MPTKMYFLRMPKPDLSDKQLEKAQMDAEVAQYKDACDRALAAAKLANEHRYQRREEYQASFAQFGVSRADREALLARLRPMRDENRQASERRQQMNAQKAQLPAATVADLEKKIDDLEKKQAHETMDRKSENALIAEIKKLTKSRAAVARFEAENPSVCPPHPHHHHPLCSWDQRGRCRRPRVRCAGRGQQRRTGLNEDEQSGARGAAEDCAGGVHAGQGPNGRALGASARGTGEAGGSLE